MPKQGIHPQYSITTFACSCGASHSIPSTLGDQKISIDACSDCHPYFTGKKRTIDRAGRVERFKMREKAADKGGAR
jgi:large subunit ribosomal protein L31